MATAAEIQLLRNADPGAVLPGIDTPTGNPLSSSSLLNYTQITQNAKGSPYYYNPANNEVYVTQNGAVLSGINFGSATLTIEANNVTVKDCTFTATSSFWAIYQAPGYSGATIENSTFQGSGLPTETNAWIVAVQPITIENNSFLNSPTDAIDFEGGVVTGNYFSGAGFGTGAHADAIQILTASGPTTITDNLIDGTWNPNAPANANRDIRIVSQGSNISNVNISGNFLLGGTYTVEIGPETNTSYTFSNVSVTNNYIGFAEYGPYYGNIQNSATIQGNTLVSYSNPTSSAQALAAYKKTAMLPANVIAATAAGQVLTSTASAPTTLLGNGLATTFVGSTNETNFVSGYGAHRLLGGEGANIFTYLAISDSTYNQHDNISNFDPAKDVIDLSRIDANVTTPGLQHFTFIGTAPFSGTGAQMRYQLNPATNQTFVEADLAGDSGNYWPDFEIVLTGLMPLTAANFALTAAQSTADIANGAAADRHQGSNANRSAARIRLHERPGQNLLFLPGVRRQHRRSTHARGRRLGPQFDQRPAPPFRSWHDGHQGRGAETLQVGTAAADTVSYHSTQVIDATSSGSENFVFATGFGSETIQGFAASGTTPDTIQLVTSSFSYLTSSMTQAQDLAAVLAKSTASATGLRIADSHGDSLTLAGLTAATITANPTAIKFA